MVNRVFAPLLHALLYHEAANRHAAGLLLERLGNDEGALAAFHEAAEGGFPPAQRKLGDIFARGNSVVKRNQYEALRWYEKARDGGEKIPLHSGNFS